MGIILKNCKVLDDEGKMISCDIKIKNDVIVQISTDIQIKKLDKVIDVNGQFVSPGFIDLHVHLREPGAEYKETIASGTLAAAKGGFTTIACMPNTNPVPDSIENLNALKKRLDKSASVKVLPYASITTLQKGESLTDIEGLKKAGAFAFSDDGVGVQEAGKMVEAMKIATSVDKVIVAHCEDKSLMNEGVVHDGVFSRKHGFRGIPSICESVQIARDVLLAEATGCQYHVCHVSSKESVRIIREAKKAKAKITAEVTPHHLLLSDEDIPCDNANYKMNPPLRNKEDQEALIEGLLDGTIDFIATDHAPHTAEEKAQGIEKAPFGIVGLETAFPLLYTNFVKKEKCTLKQLVDWLTGKPAQAFSLDDVGILKVGMKADITVIDLNSSKKINPDTFASKGKNTPFAGWVCQGWPTLTIVNGKSVWEQGGEV
ncbi:MAG: pyrC [Bacillales bacterium]|jgi:dihydroorotase|nr:pyrC [Bacillales bacterium]